MTAKELISELIIPLKPTDSVALALTMMDENKVLHLPVVDNLEFKGLISETDLLSLSSMDDPIEQLISVSNRNYITEDEHPYEVIAAFSTLQLTVLAVNDSSNHYIGAITLTSLSKYLGEIFSLKNPGGIIVLEVDENDYMLTEIAQIVESNDAKILSLYIGSHNESTPLEITIKLNKMDIEPVLQTFSRYNYSVKASFSKISYHEDLKDRFDSFLKYLNV